VFLVQKELAEKLHTQATKKSYLWRLLNLCYEITLAVDVAPTAFSPPPKVDSSLIVLSQKSEPALADSATIARMYQFLDIVSGLKRKTLGKIAKMRADQLAELGVTIPVALTSKRLEELARPEMRAISAS
jgi:16S rRNA A1518/A1519 N6-dimethyltransferase RsmA/KsgA/DIM1 with predicted DNA glycosylase/AP lyase activity